jgi:hypothetical protein
MTSRIDRLKHPLGEVLQEGLRLLQVEGVKVLGESVLDWSED